MQRRALFQTLLAGGLAGFAARAAQAQETRAQKVVSHLSDADKVNFVLANMRNHRAGGATGLQIAAVVHGPALAAFHAPTDNEPLKREFVSRRDSGDTFFACVNTLNAHQWTLADVLPGFELADKGGVVKLADLQAQGWIYLRP